MKVNNDRSSARDAGAARIPNSAVRNILIALYVLESSAALALLALYKGMDRPCPVFLGTRMGFVFIAAMLAVALSSVFVRHQVRTRVPNRWKGVRPLLLLNLLTVVLAFGTTEIALRVLSQPTAVGPTFGDQLLLPKSWDTVAAANRAILARAAVQPTFLVYDRELGWTVGRSRSSGDYNVEFQKGFVANLRARFPSRERVPDPHAEADTLKDPIYLSSAEGIRSPTAGISFAGRSAKQRIALIGDSFTFGLEVRYEQTWGALLEQALGSDYQVLNFGVDGYGVDQAYLRYRRDVRPWQPDIVILGMIDDDFRRSMCVYGFLCFPRSEIPFPKPRFLMANGELSLANVPLPLPDSIFSQRSITDLPHIEDDYEFDVVEWERKPMQAAYSMRLLLSRYRRYPERGPTVTDQAVRQVNGEIVRSFVRSVKEAGAVPMVVYFPSRTYAGPESIHPRSVAREVLTEIGVPFLDMSDCLAPIDPARRFAIVHYSSAANAAIAQCLREPVAAQAAGPLAAKPAR